MRPALKPGLRALWRDSSTVQLGTDPDTAIVLTDLSPVAARALGDLDGSLEERVVVAGRPAVRGLLEVLTELGAVADVRALAWPGSEGEGASLAPDLAALGLVHTDAPRLAARRAGARIDVVGGGRVGGQVARLLAAAGVGTVVLRDGGAVGSADLAPGAWGQSDLGTPRGRLLRGRRRDAGSNAPADLVVLCPHPPGLADQDLAEALTASGTPHLLAAVREVRGVVGPLVLPPAGPCLACLELHRVDADPGWARVAAQSSSGHPGQVNACDGPLAAAVAALAARQALAWVGSDRRELPEALTTGSLGATLELGQGDWRVRRRSWIPHPGCTHGGP